MKRISKLLMFFGLLTITAIAVVWFRLDAIAQTSLEESLSKALGVQSEIASLSINKFAGKAHIDELSIENPEGYSADHIFKVRDLDIAFTPLSLFGSTLEVSSLRLDNINVNFEQRLRDNNILEIVNYVNQRKTSQGDPRIVSAQISFKGKRFEIESANLDNIAVNVNFSPLGNLLPFDGLSKEIQVNVPDIELENINSENAQFVLAGTLEEVAADLLGGFAGDIFQEIPKQMESDQVDGLLGDLIDQLPF